MRKSITIMLTVLFAIAMSYNLANAISGQCVNCHTMHNSQDGAVVDSSGPNDRLLVTGCVSCHTGASGKTNAVTNAPIVLHTSDPTDQGGGFTNAGGSFYWVDGGATDSMGHNVAGISSVDGDVGSTPPGFDQAATTGVTFDGKTLAVDGANWGTGQLSCAGTLGCHGTRDADDFGAIQGAHHNNPDTTATQATSPTTVGNSYRFLAGIKGIEDANWNFSETATTHNEYFGKDDNANYNDKSTISYLCAECHGAFHKEIGRSASPWTRHPTDIVLPNSGEYAAYTAYSVEAPIARPSLPPGDPSVVTPGTDIVMCLSCHRAHGSPVADLLRFPYSDMIAGDNTKSGGCFTCHTTKND